MLYNKAEKRVLQYLSALEKRTWTRQNCCLEVFYEQRKAYTEETVFPKLRIESYPFPFGTEGQDTIFSFELEVPDLEEVFLSFPLGTDALVAVNKNPECNVNPYHEIMNISRWKGQQALFEIRCWDGYIYPGWHPLQKAHLLTVTGKKQQDYPIMLGQPAILSKNVNQYELWHDLVVITETVLELDPENLQRQQVMSKLHKALMELSLVTEDAAVLEGQAAKVLETTRRILNAKNGTIAPDAYSVGMAHLDHAWVWPKRETLRKAARTLSGMFHLMEEYPEFVFLSTQPVQMDHVFAKYPVLYKRALEMFRRGQFEPNGVGLVEADGVLSSGEGLIRNFLYGRQVTSRLFPGYRGDTYVLPDSFGYNGNLPQIMAGCGVKYFITSKLSWNDTNRFPYDLFLWRGIDGTQVKAHMLPGSYNGTSHPRDIIRMWNNVLHKDVQTSLLRTVGEGDGGGGTRREDIEFLRRMKDFQGCPRSSWTTVSKAMERIFSETSELPVYEGEMYFELHRGTYTSQALMKQGYRRINALLHDAEYLLSFVWAKKRISNERCREISYSIREIWKTTVVNQFHDILPGSCVGIEYEEVNAFYEQAGQKLCNLIGELAKPGSKELNLTPFIGNDIAPYSTKRLFASESLGGLSVEVASDGTIDSVTYKGRQLSRGAWNVLRIGEDVPLQWDAWDLEKDSLEHLKKAVVPYDGLLRQGSIGEHSTIAQKIIVDERNCRIDFVTDIDWHEDHKVLRVEFPTTVFAENAIFDIPFGYVSRSTHNNTSHETAQFESPAHKFVMIRDEGVSVALMSDSKYGYSAKDGCLGMTMLKSAKAPDANADMGHHHFVYSVFVGDGSLQATIAEAENLNNPHLQVSEDYSPLVRASEGLAVETVKLAESVDSVVFRVRETLGCSNSGTLELDPCLDGESLCETDMLEEKEGKPSFSFHPFEIKTYKVRRS